VIHAVHPGTFDPPTLGHLDLVLRARTLFPRVTVLVAQNARKSTLFSNAERVALWRQILESEGVSDVSVEGWEGLTVEWCRSRGVSVMVRGLRHGGDFESEMSIALMNRRLASGIETVYLPSRESHLGLTSTLVREVARCGGDVAPFVPSPVIDALRRKLSNPEPPT
jgi:pantetheine-phosphate adenylyltransferase